MRTLQLTILFAVVILVAFFVVNEQGSPLSSILGVKTELVEFPDGYTIGAYLWKSPDDMTNEEIDRIFALAKKDKINTIYVDISKYIDITEIKSKRDRKLSTEKFESSLMNFVAKARVNNISVSTLGGNTTWANNSHQYVPLALLRYTMDFNNRFPNTSLTGIQFDIEYYSNKDYQTSKTLYSSSFLTLVTNLVSEVQVYQNNYGKFSLGFSVPFWLNDDNGNRIFNNLADKLNVIDDSYLSIMAYRNYPHGRDGSISIVKEEASYVLNNAQRVGVIVAQDANNGDLAKTTFYGKSKRDMKSAVNMIIGAYKNNGNFKGISINDIFSYEALRN